MKHGTSMVGPSNTYDKRRTGSGRNSQVSSSTAANMEMYNNYKRPKGVGTYLGTGSGGVLVLPNASRTLDAPRSNKAIVDIILRPRCAICCHCTPRRSRTAWRPLANTLEMLTACFSTVPMSLLPTPRAVYGHAGRMTHYVKT